LNDIDYISRSFSLTNFDGRIWGCFADNSIHLNDLKKSITFFIIMSVSMIIILSLIVFLNKVRNNLFDKKSKIEVRIEK
jgi:hypothetical protein